MMPDNGSFVGIRRPPSVKCAPHRRRGASIFPAWPGRPHCAADGRPHYSPAFDDLPPEREADMASLKTSDLEGERRP